MQLTFIGLIISIIGLILLFRGGVLEALLLMMGCSLMGGSAALILPALGGSSIMPEQYALAFALARIVLPGSRRLGLAVEALRSNLYLALFSLYGLFSGYFGPRLFRGAIRVPPMRGSADMRSIDGTIPLEPSNQNVTASVYMVGSALAAIVSYVAMQEPKAARRFVQMGLFVTWTHITLGIAAAVLKGTPFDLFVSLMRNANYAQLDQDINGYVRITGIFPEPSAYGSFGFTWFVFMVECWLRDIKAKQTGFAAAAMGLVLAASTSSTVYVALAIYTIVFICRMLLFPQYLGAKKGLALAGSGLVLLIFGSAMSLMIPKVFDSVVAMLHHLTFEKSQSDSGVQRASWAKTGLTAFIASYGVGIGPGSFRSSSNITAVAGSLGLFGLIFMFAHLARVMKPLRASTYAGYRDFWRYGEEAMIGAAAGWAAFGILLPASVSAPTCDLGCDFAVFSGVALALRQRRRLDSNAMIPSAEYHVVANHHERHLAPIRA